MKPLLLTALILFPFTAPAAETPSRWGGMFGFGSSKQKGDQISAGLFPSETPSSVVTPQVTSTVPAATEESIFRSGEPVKVEPVSYAIENGQKVEKEVDKKKPSIFSFGKREDSGIAENQVLAPVPAPTPPAPVQSAPIVAVPNPIPLQASPSEVITASPTASPVSPAPAPPKDRFSWIPFLSKKKDEPVVPNVAPQAAEPASTLVASEITPSITSPTAAAPSTGAGAEKAKPNTPSLQQGATSFEVPKKTDAEVVEKPKAEGGGILAPIAKIRPPRKEIDLTNAETIIQNGEIIAPSETTFDSTVTPATSTERRPPAVVNGVKTYSSWDDVEGKATSAADRIINQIR